MRGPAESVQAFTARLTAARAAMEKARAGGQLNAAELECLEASDVLTAMNLGALAELGVPPSKHRR